MKYLSIFFTVLFFSTPVMAQEEPDLDFIRGKFRSFEYRTVIQLSNILLNREKNLSKEEKIEIHLMKGISYYSISDEQSARESFIDILDLDKNYKIDPVRISPKIALFFQKVRSEYFLDFPEIIPVERTVADTTNKITKRYDSETSELIKGSVTRSILVPGWGHLYRDDDVKGWTITTAGIAALVSSAYFIVKTASDEKDYLNERDPLLLDEKYNRYNSSYKIRNALILSYAAIWLYSQLDILVFDQGLPEIKSGAGNSPVSIGLSFRL